MAHLNPTQSILQLLWESAELLCLQLWCQQISFCLVSMPSWYPDLLCPEMQHNLHLMTCFSTRVQTLFAIVIEVWPLSSLAGAKGIVEQCNVMMRLLGSVFSSRRLQKLKAVASLCALSTKFRFQRPWYNYSPLTPDVVFWREVHSQSESLHGSARSHRSFNLSQYG